MNTDDCITEILDRWKEAEQQGTPLSIDELCADWPELRKEVERQINALLEADERFRHAPTVVFSADENSNDISNDISDDTVSTECELTSLKFHAKGGLGSVYRAKDEQVHRDVAVKFIHQKLVADRVSRDRFALEAEITGRLEHPGVVPLYGIGESEHGRSFYTMRFIDGETLDQAIAENHDDQQREENASQRRLRFRELLTHLVSACKTVAYAHTRGIVHRDIKPDNIMLGRYGETTVLDWGLAMPVSRDDRFKESGEETLIPSLGKTSGLSGGAGTPAYMSPEQASGLTPTPASDVYSLGVTLYKLLTGQTAFKGQQLEEVKKKVIENTFPTPRSVLADIPRPLEAVCLKAMSLHPHQRYADASELARDIEHYLADERVSAYREPWTTTAMRWCRRRRSLAQGIVVGLVVILVAGTLVITSALHHREDLVQEKIERVKATATAEESILLSKIEGLEQDIRFLASRPQIQESLSLADDQDRKTEVTAELTAIFRDFIDEKPSYMQARLIDSNGMEVVRVERGKSGEPVNEALRLRDKSESQYFKDTMKLAADEVYLSKLELNVEDGVKDWGFPVIRAAMPVFDEAHKCSGIVIINMHFSHLEKLVAASKKNDMLVYLTNEQGEYLLHPTRHIGFCFERKLDFRVQVTYPLLNPFINSDERVFEQTAVQPRISMLLERAPNKNVKGNSLNRVVKSIIQTDTNLSSSFSEQGEDREFAVITNIQDESQANEIRDRIEENVVRAVVLPTRYRSANQAIYCRKIFFDKRKPERFILLVLVAPH